MCLLMSGSYKDTDPSEPSKSFRCQDETDKKGVCLLEIRRTGMVQWGSCSDSVSNDQHEESNPQLSYVVIKEERKDDEEGLAAEPPVLPEVQKRKRYNLNQCRELRSAKSMKHEQIIDGTSTPSGKDNSMAVKKEQYVQRWTIERYKRAEKSLLEVMKAEGAAFDNPISRPMLRTAARKCVGDTGLLDHLLKHIDGKVAPGGTERFRRCYNTEGIMEYWLESADLAKIKREAGVPDSSWWKPAGEAIRESVCAGELTLLKEEITKMKRDMEELASKKQDEQQANIIQEMHQDLVKWRGETDQRLLEISSSLNGIQDMYRDMVAWKSKTEQQLVEISNSLGNVQAPKECENLSPACERWEDWLESSNLDNIQGEGFVPWMESTDLANVGQDASMQDPYTVPQPWLNPSDSSSQDNIPASQLELLKEDVAKMKRDMQELVSKRTKEDQANVIPDSSVNANSKLDLSSSLLLFQEMFKELVKWKAKMEQQILEISNSLTALRASKQYTF